jgi:hypothetical protein
MSSVTANQPRHAEGREHPVMRWGAVFAGWFVAMGMALVLYAFGLAVGFTAFDPRDTAAVTHGITTGTVVWTILTWGAALWTGGMFASWFDGRNDTEMGVVRGLAVWGVSMTATALVIASGLAHAAFLIPPPESATPTLDRAQAAHYVAAFMWAAFGSSLVALVTSAFGGWLGAHHVHHVYHVRKYLEHGRDG